MTHWHAQWNSMGCQACWACCSATLVTPRAQHSPPVVEAGLTEGQGQVHERVFQRCIHPVTLMA